ncbi:TPA: hypothetical protein N2G38_003212 [Salmonella enterica]|nr:hypothetical protein [Salmonella enterica]
MIAEILSAKSGGLNPHVSTTYKNYAGQYVLRPNLPQHCLAAGYAASCPNVKSNRIALYGKEVRHV